MEKHAVLDNTSIKAILGDMLLIVVHHEIEGDFDEECKVSQ
jgi:hypothetical protein